MRSLALTDLRGVHLSGFLNDLGRFFQRWSEFRVIKRMRNRIRLWLKMFWLETYELMLNGIGNELENTPCMLWESQMEHLAYQNFTNWIFQAQLQLYFKHRGCTLGPYRHAFRNSPGQTFVFP